ncbi:MAG: FCD domain-containing protein [Sphingobium sp.]
MDNCHSDDAISAKESDTRRCSHIAQNLYDQISSGKLVVGDRLPSERELGKIFSVSRPTIRAALIALEIRGYVDIRPGAGTHVIAAPSRQPVPDTDMGVLERIQACLVIEGEAAALAAANISDADLAELDRLAQLLDRNDQRHSRFKASERKFHLMIARATNNGTLLAIIQDLWQTLDEPVTKLRRHASGSHPANSWQAGHRAVVRALYSHDPQGARNAMRVHLGALLTQFLFAIEEAAVEKAREAGRSIRQRFTKART